MPVQMQPASIDWSQLATIGENIGRARRERQLRSMFADGLPMGANGIDWDAAIARISQLDPVTGLKIAAQRAEADAMGRYRSESLKPEVVREYEYMYGPQGGGQRVAEGPSFTDYASGRKGGTAAEKSVDTAFGKEYAAWRAGGGYAATKKQIGQLGDAATRLESGENITGPYIGQIPDRLVPMFNPASKEVRDQVEEAIQSSLRQVLGAQYTEREGVALLRRTWDPTLDDAVNAKRVRRVLNQLNAMAQAKEDAANYYEQNGSLRGWQGPSFSVDEINPDMPSPDEGNQTAVPRLGPTPRRVPTYNVSPTGEVSATAIPGANTGPNARFRTPNNPEGYPPTQENIQALRQMANDPQARAVFDEHFGKGAAEWFLTGGR